MADQLSASRQFTIALTLAAYCGVILVGVSHHEPWADEAHHWVLSRDVGYRYLVFHQLAYDGIPPLWPTILWIANHWFHLPYQALGWIGGLCAIAGCWFFCRYSPFPLWVRVLFPFTYFMAYQYAIVARPYVLLPLCIFATAHFFGDAERRPWRFVGAISALALLSAAGVMIAVGIMVARVWYTLRGWREVPRPMRKQLIAALLVFGIVLSFVAFVNWPPADSMTARVDRKVAEPSDDSGTFGIAMLPRDISVAFLGRLIPSVAVLVIVGGWCACRRRPMPFVLPTALTLVFFVVVYGRIWHGGALVLTAVAAVWIAWDSPPLCASKFHAPLNALMLLAAASLLVVQIYWAARTLAMDYSRPYSGSKDAANFLRSVGADASSTCGFGFHTVAIQPYFRESIFGNWPKGESFWRFETGNRSLKSCHNPTWVVLPICCTFDRNKQDFPQLDRYWRSSGYSPVHISQGALFFEGRETEPATFVIYKAAE